MGQDAPAPAEVPVESETMSQHPGPALEDVALAVVDALLQAVDESRAVLQRPGPSDPAIAPAVSMDASTRALLGLDEVATGVCVVFTDGTSVALAPDEELVIGRAGGPGRHALSLPQLSRGHVSIRAVRDGAWVTDLRSTNGTRRRRQHEVVDLPPDHPEQVLAGDQLLVGSQPICVIEAFLT